MGAKLTVNRISVKKGIKEPAESAGMLPSINVLNASELITGDDAKFLQDHASAFEKRYRTRSYFRSETEMRAGVLNDNEHPTPDSKYWQAIGEQNVHIVELISLDFESKKLEADIELLQLEIDEMLEELVALSGFEASKMKIKIRRKQVEHEQKKFNLTQQRKTAQERMREIRTWEPIIKELESQLKFGDEDFGLHHPERYFLRYKKRAERLNLVDPEARENVVSHFESFSKSYQESVNKQLPTGQTCNLDYKSLDEVKVSDPVAKGYFDRKVKQIMICIPHRQKGDRSATNVKVLQPPAGVSLTLFEPYGYSIPDARNICVKEAIEKGVDYLFFIDDDTLIPRTALVRLYKHNADVVGGLYYRKYLPIETVGMYEDKDGCPGSLDKYEVGEVIHNTLVLPSGCTLFKVEALKKISPPWYKTITVQGRPTLTEDTYMSQRLRDVGVDVITDTGIQCIHVDFSRGIFYGHPSIVDSEKNEIKEEYRDYFAI